MLITGPITMLMIAWYMSPEIQGFHYTFASVLALQSFVELGFYLVIINVASHEWSNLSLDQDGRIVGDSDSLSRLISLGRLIFKWYAVGGTIFIVGAGIAGYLFFSQRPYPGVSWHAPWLILVILTGLLLWALPFNSLLEGCNQVANIQKFRLTQAILSNFAMWTTLYLGGGLWAPVASAGMSVLRDLYLIGVEYRRFFEPFLKLPTGLTMHWRTEIWPMQWRLALSGMVNYFSFSLFNPVMFHYHGAAIAGQMGMAWRLVSAVQSIALMWVYTKVPRFGILIAKKDYHGLDRFWLKTSFISLIVVTVGASAAWALVYYLNVLNISLYERILSPLPVGLFLLASIFMQVSQCQTAYLRAHKQEPIVVMSVTTSLIIGLLVWLLGSRFGPLGAASSYLCVIVLLGIPWETLIWLGCRNAWHKS